MDFRLPEPALRARAAARAFTRAALQPVEPTLPHGAGALPAPVVQALQEQRRQAGWWGLTVPSAEGGRGLSWTEQAAVQEEWHRSPLGLFTLGLFVAGEPPEPLYACTPAQRTRYLRPCLEGARASQVRLPPQRPGSGAGLRARRVPGGIRLDGLWPAAPAIAAEHLLVAIAATDEGEQAFLCEPGMPGMEVRHRRPGMGALELADLAWVDCFLPGTAIVPGIGAAARRWEARQRTAVLAAGALGAAERCLGDALSHARARQTFGRPLADRQGIQWMLADSARELHAARLLVYRAASLADAGEDAAPWAARAKAYTAAAACRVVDRVIQIFGGYGYCADLPYERYWRELRAYRLLEGVDEELLAAADGEDLAAERAVP